MKFENLITLINTVSGSKLTGFKYEEEGVKIELSKKEGKVQVVSAQTVAPTAEVNTEVHHCLAWNRGHGILPKKQQKRMEPMSRREIWWYLLLWEHSMPPLPKVQSHLSQWEIL